MKTLKLKSLGLKNFKGIDLFTINPGGENLDIAGDNGTGKTTMLDAFTWLFDGKDSSGKADFKMKPQDKNGEDIHNLTTEVTGVIEVHGENELKTITLKRRYQEKYTKKRGTATEEFTGHTTDYFIDDIPKKQNEFKDFIEEIIDPAIFKLITNPFEFNNLPWKDRRNILFEVCGNVDDKDVIDSDKALAGLKGILKDCSMDDHKKKVKAQQSEINKELTLIPARIDENNISLKDLEPLDPAKKKGCEKALAEAELELSQLKSNETLSKKKIELNEIDNKIFTEKNKVAESQGKTLQPLRDRIKDLETRKFETELKISNLRDVIKQDESRNVKTEETMNNLRKQFAEKKDQDVDAKTECPACGQDLPEDEIQEAIEKFNTARAEALKDNNAEGKKLSEGLKERLLSIENASKEIIELMEELKKIEEKISKREKEIEELNQDTIAPDTSKLEDEKKVVEDQIKELKGDTEVQEAEIELRINEIKSLVEAHNVIEAEHKAADTAKERITKLEQDEKKLAAEYEKLESELFVIDQFIVKKVELVEDKINSKFKMATFRLFEKQINQGINEVCETLHNGIPFNHGLNSAARINVGLDIINTLSEYYGFQSVIFVDNKESTNKLTETDAQVITLTVTKDKNLKIT